MIVTWSHNASFVDRSQITTTGNATTLVIENLQPSDAGDYINVLLMMLLVVDGQ